MLNSDAGDPGKAVARQDRLAGLVDKAGEVGADFMMNLSGTNPMVLSSIQEKLENGETLESIPQLSDFSGSVSEEVALAAVGRANGDNSHYEALSLADQGRVKLAEAATILQGADYREVTAEQQQKAYEAMEAHAQHELGLSPAIAQHYAAQFVDGEGAERYREHGEAAIRDEYMHNTGKTPEQITEQDHRNIESIGARVENASKAGAHADSVLAPVDHFYDLHSGGAAFGKGQGDQQVGSLERAPDPTPIPAATPAPQARHPNRNSQNNVLPPRNLLSPSRNTGQSGGENPSGFT